MKEITAEWLKTLRIEGKPDEWESKQLLKKAGIKVLME